MFAVVGAGLAVVRPSVNLLVSIMSQNIRRHADQQKIQVLFAVSVTRSGKRYRAVWGDLQLFTQVAA